MSLAAPDTQDRAGTPWKVPERRFVKRRERREHIWRHGEREWKATPDGLWARPVGREHWTFEMWFTPVVGEILRLSSLTKRSVPVISLAPEPAPDEPPVPHDPDDDMPGDGDDAPRCGFCGAETSWNDDTCAACGEEL